MFQVTIYRAPEWGIKALKKDPYFTNPTQIISLNYKEIERC